MPGPYRDVAGSYDLVVIGSGSAGLSAALAASEAGLSVLILEKSTKIGGTSAYSGAGTWIPANHHAARAGITDSIAEAVQYLQATGPDGWDKTESALWQAFAENAPVALEFIEENTPLVFELLDIPDTFPEAPGGKTKGRMLSPGMLDISILGSWAKKLRASFYPQVFRYAEMYELEPMYASRTAQLAMLPRLILRYFRKQRGLGTALVAGLLKGCLDNACRLVENARVMELLTDADGAVRGVVAAINGVSTRIQTNVGVVIASGGYEWDRERLETHFPGPKDFLASPRTNEGDGHRMAEAVGAELAHMDQANINSAIPGRCEGQIQGLGWFQHRAPNSIIVNALGERFCNEEDDNLGLNLDHRGPGNVPLFAPYWLISDASFLERERLAIYLARCKPEWLRKARSLKGLAAQIGLDGGTLEVTVRTFNEALERDHEDPFSREDRKAIIKPPFVATPQNRSFMSTKGGPRTDCSARVLRKDGTVIVGLYCAGVAMANPIGTKAIAAGTTIGPNLTWGYIAGRHAARLKHCQATG